MAPRARHSEEYELLRRGSNDSLPTSDTDFGHYAAPTPTEYFRLAALSRVRQYFAKFRILLSRLGSQSRKRRSPCRVFCLAILIVALCITVLIVTTALFRPSYTHLPDHYKKLQKLCLASSKPGRGNPNNEKVFIAAAIYDREGELVGGDWGKSILDLVQLLGPDNVYMSIYENDADDAANSALDNFKQKLTCE